MYKTVLASTEFGFLVNTGKFSLKGFWILVGQISLGWLSSWRVVLGLFFGRELLGELGLLGFFFNVDDRKVSCRKINFSLR